MATFKEFIGKAIDNLIESGPIYFMTTLWLFLGNFIGLFFVCYFSDIKIINFGQVIIWGLAIFLLGALMGIIFGVPKTVSSPIAAAAAASGTTTPAKAVALNSNTTNLTEISDWLTKIVIGAGLVQLKSLPPYLWKVAGKMAIGMVAQPHLPPVSLCAAIIIYYLCFGLLCGYFIMRTIFAQIFNQAG